MIYLVTIIAGYINGLFSSGAGQILVFVYIYLLKLDTHESRAKSILLIGCATIFSIFSYIKIVKYDLLEIAIVIISGLICGVIGAKISSKIDENKLNLISGILLIVFGIISMVKK